METTDVFCSTDDQATVQAMNANAVAGHPLVSLSEQEFVSCVAATPPGGQCHGELPS